MTLIRFYNVLIYFILFCVYSAKHLHQASPSQQPPPATNIANMSIINRQLTSVSTKLSARILSTSSGAITGNSHNQNQQHNNLLSTISPETNNNNNNNSSLDSSNIITNKSLCCCNLWSGASESARREVPSRHLIYQQPQQQQQVARTAAPSAHGLLSNLNRLPQQNGFGTNLVRRFSSTAFDDLAAMSTLTGVDLLREPNVNKDLAFTEEERKNYKLRGLLPAAIRPQNLQIQIVMENLRQLTDDLGKYMLLRDLQDHNKRLFYQVLQVHTKELMPIVYTPIVGLACQKYSLIFKRPRGMFITLKDRGHIDEILSNWESDEIKAIVVTDGERILGLGDLGANGMGIPVGKMALYSAIGGIPPEYTLPVTLDVGTNNEALLADPYYIGVREKRESGQLYDELVDEFMNAVVKRWGRTCLIQFEDFGNKNAFRFLEKYKRDFCTFNDDIQGTASVAVAGIIASCKITGGMIKDHRFLFLGAGEAALGIANLLVKAMVQDGLSVEDARKQVTLMDSSGLITTTRGGRKDPHKEVFAKNLTDTKDLLEVVNMVKPTSLIGAAAVPGAFNETILRKMAELNKRPIIFALSNPTSKAECTAENAYKFTDGRCVFASGSPFDTVKLNGQVFNPGQGNNAYIFPGVALAVMACQVHEITDDVFLVAAKALAEEVEESDFKNGAVYPCLEKINDTSIRIAVRVSEYLYAEGYAQHKPVPDDMLKFIKSHLYDASYDGSDFTKHIEEAHKAWST